jgi:hypothetical protein
MRCDLRGRGRGRMRGRGRAADGDGDGDGEGACEDEGEGGGACEHARARANARARASARVYVIFLIWRGARASARWRGRRRGSVHGRGALQARDELRASTQRNCMQARSARERRGGGMPSAREGKQAQTQTTGERAVRRSKRESLQRDELFLKRVNSEGTSTPC